MGTGGEFTFNNIHNDPYPWFSHQHDAGMENNGAGPLSLFDNGNTRISLMGSGSNRGMALTVDESAMQVTPVLSQSLGVYSPADGSAQLLSSGNYFFLAANVISGVNSEYSYSIQLYPTAGVKGAQALNIQAANGYRAWQMPSLYEPPIT